jgi:hypothetical protein
MRSLRELVVSTVVLYDLQAEFGTASATEDSKVQTAPQLLFLSCLCSEKQELKVSLVAMSHPSQRTIAPPPYLPLDRKDFQKEDMGFFDRGWIDWWAVCENDAADGLLSFARDQREHGIVQICTENFIHRF